MSSTPTGTSTPSIPRMACAIRCASGTPRRTIPINARFFVPPLFSTISCASRCRVRSISGADINWVFSTMRMGRVILSSLTAPRSIHPATRSFHGGVVDCAANRGGPLAMALRMSSTKRKTVSSRAQRGICFSLAATLLALFAIFQPLAAAQAKTPAANSAKSPAKPKLVVLLVVDQMRADYVDKFLPQWTGGLKRLVEEGAWFRDAAYPYAATETCVGHATISTGAFPSTHGMISNEWFDRELQKTVACTDDSKVKNLGYAGASVTGGNSASKMLVPAFADELKFQTGGGTRVVTFSLKARAAITMGGRLGSAVTWFDADVGAWTTSSAYPVAAFVEEFAKAHPAAADYGKTWAPMLPASAYLYDATATGAGPPAGLGAAFPHPLRGKPDSTGPDPVFYCQWETSPYADTYLTRIAETAVDKLELGARAGTDFLAVSYSSVDYVGHAFGPRSWEIQDVLVRLDQDLAELFAH